MKILVPAAAIVILLSCTARKERQSYSVADTTYIQTFDSLPGSELKRLLSIDIKHKFNEKYSGKYSYKLISGDSILHGDFFLLFSDSSSYTDASTNEIADDMARVSKMKYSGQFRNGKKYGPFIEDLLFDDGIDLYSKWIIQISFEDDQCKSGSFSGLIGHVMPDTTFQFERLKQCSFDHVTDLAQEEWSKEWERRNKSR